jgi:hypothetical protein
VGKAPHLKAPHLVGKAPHLVGKAPHLKAPHLKAPHLILGDYADNFFFCRFYRVFYGQLNQKMGKCLRYGKEGQTCHLTVVYVFQWKGKNYIQQPTSNFLDANASNKLVKRRDRS